MIEIPSFTLEDLEYESTTESFCDQLLTDGLLKIDCLGDDIISEMYSKAIRFFENEKKSTVGFSNENRFGYINSYDKDEDPTYCHEYFCQIAQSLPMDFVGFIIATFMD